MTNKPSSKSEKKATVDEISEAIANLRTEDWAKLAAFAENRARFMRLYGAAVDGSDVMQRAILNLLKEQRTWNPQKVTFVGVVLGVMRSIASNKKAESLRNGYAIANSQLASATDDEGKSQTPLDLAADPRRSAELQLVATERESEITELVSDLYDFFEADVEAQLVMSGWREGKSGPDIIADLGMDRRAYETIVRRIRRKSTARWPKGSGYVN